MRLRYPSIPAALCEQVRREPGPPAYAFVDYEVDPRGYSETLTWSEDHQRAQAVAAELASYGNLDDRVAIVAPQGLEYVIRFLGTLEAGFLPVSGKAVSINPFDDDDDSCFVSVNDEVHHSLWPVFADIPAGRQVIYGEADRAACGLNRTELAKYTAEESGRDAGSGSGFCN